LVEQCDRCKGLFFDNGELQALLDSTVTTAFEIDFARLQALSASAPLAQEQLCYRSCPVCSKLMNRKNFGARSGVVVDWCGQHGMWLDNGELRRLLEWRQAGGELLHEQFKREQEQAEEKKRQRRSAEQHRDAFTDGSFVLGGHHPGSAAEPRTTMLDVLGHLFGLH
jgi:Zn-finger nucleic acid-binding protein